MTTLTLNRGIARRENGKHQVASHNHLFLYKARCQAVIIAQANGKVSVDDLREWADSEGIAPDHPNAWGSLFKSCPLQGCKFKRGGSLVSAYPSNHGRLVGYYYIAPKGRR